MFRVLPKAITLLIFALIFPAGAAEQVHVATPTQGLIELPVVVAMRNRYSEPRAGDPKIQIEPEVAVKALVAGEVDFSFAWEASVRSAISGAPIKWSLRPCETAACSHITARTPLRQRSQGQDFGRRCVL